MEITGVVVPVDFMENTDKLVDYATLMAGKLSAVIHFVHVVNFPNNDLVIGRPFVTEFECCW